MIQFFREVKQNRKVMGSSIKEEPLPFLVRFRKPMKVVVTYEGGWKRVAEDVVEIQQGRRDVIFLRRYPGGSLIRCPYKNRWITSLHVRTSHQEPERNYYLAGY